MITLTRENPARQPHDLMNSPADTPHRSGYVALIGNPNAGKSTLMNQILGSRVSITTHKPQTTRHQILGIHSDEDSQIMFLDTPGVLTPSYELQSAMMRFVERARQDADIILFIVDGTDASTPDRAISILHSLQKPIWLVINKLDRIDRTIAEEIESRIREKLRIDRTFQLSALNGDGTGDLLQSLKVSLPEGPPYYPKEMLSEQPMRFFAAELIREQIFLQFHEEIPYSCTVEVFQYEEQEKMDVIRADIIVNRSSQKGMLIGKGGKAIRNLGTEARASIEEFTGRHIFLDLHVKVREKWREKEQWVRQLGYNS
ncbi:MAG: GTPase Era [Balneolaceae bacterium]